MLSVEVSRSGEFSPESRPPYRRRRAVLRVKTVARTCLPFIESNPGSPSRCSSKSSAVWPSPSHNRGSAPRSNRNSTN